MGVPVVHRVGFHPGSEDRFADRVHTDVAAGNERLELSRAVTQEPEPSLLIRAESPDDRTDAAC